jgi:hypothetical protein
MYTFVTKFSVFILVSMVDNITFTFIFIDIKFTKVSTDLIVTMVTSFTDVSKISQSLWLGKRDINV